MSLPAPIPQGTAEGEKRRQGFIKMTAAKTRAVRPSVMPIPTYEQRTSARLVTPPMPVASVPFAPAPAQYAPPPTSFTPMPVKQTFV